MGVLVKNYVERVFGKFLCGRFLYAWREIERGGEEEG